VAELTVRGATLAYDDEGGGQPAFVFIHGWACDRSTWRPQVEDLSRDFRCINVDLRGRGESQPMPPFDTTTAADDVADMIRQLGIAPVIIVGHSLGGLVALLVNDRHPELVLGIVIGDPPLTAASAGSFARGAQRITEAGSMEAARDQIESFFADSTPGHIRDYVRKMTLSCPADVGAGMISDAEVFHERMTDLIKKADARPFMAIWPPAPRGNPDALRQVTTFLRQEPIADVGHFFQIERPEVTNALLRAFVDDVRRDPRLQPRATQDPS
jgi:pimeloyl-ACP methyl ester carboxylesterase